MKKDKSLLINIAVFAVISALVVLACVFCYKYCNDFRALFGGSTVSETIGKVAEDGQTIARRNARAGWISLSLFTAIIVVQIFCLFTAITVFRNIRKSAESAKVKLERIANADVFLDLPLYVGLFGSVSSFMVMSISSSGGQLIAYSSTLIGIIFCTCMRLAIMYPLKSSLIAEERGK